MTTLQALINQPKPQQTKKQTFDIYFTSKIDSHFSIPAKSYGEAYDIASDAINDLISKCDLMFIANSVILHPDVDDVKNDLGMIIKEGDAI